MELLGITVIIWIVGVVAAVMLFLMPFFVFKIRNEVVEINEVNKRMLVLLESVVPESKKPPKPKMGKCAVCGTENEVTRIHCRHCRSRLAK